MLRLYFTFAESPFPIVELLLGLLTVGGTALATFLAAKYTGENANKIARQNNEFQRKERESSDRKRALIEFDKSYNDLYHYIKDFYSRDMDARRTTLLAPHYKDTSIPVVRKYIDTNFLRSKNIMNCSREGAEQIKDYNMYLNKAHVNLESLRFYITNEEYTELDSNLKIIKTYAEYVTGSLYRMAYTSRPGDNLMIIGVCHVEGDITTIKDGNWNESSPQNTFAHLFYVIYESKKVVDKLIEKYLKIDN